MRLSLFKLEEVASFINSLSLSFFRASGTDKVIIYSVYPQPETIGVIDIKRGWDITSILLIITREVHQYLLDNEVPNHLTLDIDVLKLIFEDVIPEEAQTIAPTEWHNWRGGDDVIGG